MHKQVIEFWFDEIEPVMWFKRTMISIVCCTAASAKSGGRRRRESWLTGATPSKGGWRR